MSGQTIRAMIGIARRGVVSGVLAFAGISVAVDNPGWVGYTAAGLTTLVLTVRTAGAGRTAGDRERLFRDHGDAALPAADFQALDAVAQSRTVSVETVRDIRADGPEPGRSARVGVLMADDRNRTGTAYLAHASTAVSAADLATLEYDRAGGRQSATHPGSIRLGDTLPPNRRRRLEFPLLADVPLSRRLAAPAGRRGAGRAAIATWCAAFVIAGTATGALMPDASAIGDLARNVVGEISGSDTVTDPDAQLRNLLASAEKAVPGSTKYVRSVSIRDSSSTLTAHDPGRSKDFRVTNSSPDPDYDSTMAVTRGTFPLSSQALPDLASVSDRAVAAMPAGSAPTLDKVDIERPSEKAEPLLTVSMTVSGGSQQVQATMAGDLAPVFTAQNLRASYARAADLLRQQGFGKGDRVIRKLIIQSSVPGTPAVATSDIQNDGGILLELAGPKGSPTIYQIPGQFPVLDAGSNSSSDTAALLSLNDISLSQLERTVKQVADKSGAEKADLEMIGLLVEAGTQDDHVTGDPRPTPQQAPPTLTLKLGSLAESEQPLPVPGR